MSANNDKELYVIIGALIGGIGEPGEDHYTNRTRTKVSCEYSRYMYSRETGEWRESNLVTCRKRKRGKRRESGIFKRGLHLEPS